MGSIWTLKRELHTLVRWLCCSDLTRILVSRGTNVLQTKGDTDSFKGPNFIQTMAPVASELQPSGYGLGGFSYKTLDAKATASNKPNGKLINWFNPQFYVSAQNVESFPKITLTRLPEWMGRRQHTQWLSVHNQKRLRRQPCRHGRPRQSQRRRQRLVQRDQIPSHYQILTHDLRIILRRRRRLGILGRRNQRWVDVSVSVGAADGSECFWFGEEE